MIRDVFKYKKPNTSQKERQFLLRFYIQKYRHFVLRNFHGIFEIGGGGGAFLYATNNAPCITVLYAKNNALCVTVIYI